tara:strand:- start:554 stop:763 length:210 start_codon:yes stop_codon:yes gene_type:complete
MFGLNKCSHKWKVLSESTTISKFEHAMNQLKNTTGSSTIPGQMACAERKHILVISCDECGKVIRYVEGI